MEERDKKFAQFILDYFNTKIKLNESDWNLIQKARIENDFNNTLELRMKQKPGLMYINWVVADWFGFDSLLIASGKTRLKDLTQPRQICYWIARNEYNYELQEIADFFGKKSHVTIMSGIKRTNNLMETEKEYNALVHLINDKIRNGKNNQRTDSTTGTGSIQKDSNTERNDLLINRYREVKDSDRLHQGEQEDIESPDNITANQS